MATDYVYHNGYAKSPQSYIRAFLLLQKDLQLLFNYIEPADDNLACYSARIHELLLRACVEVEANCKAILVENGYSRTTKNGKPQRLDMTDYRKIDKTHRLSKYEVEIPYWRGKEGIQKPFNAWASDSSLIWYDAYNTTKHDRYQNFEQANFKNMLDAICGVFVLLSSQFALEQFSTSGVSLLGFTEFDVDFELGIGNFFQLRFPKDWPEDEKYDFDWETLKDKEEPFESLKFE